MPIGVISPKTKENPPQNYRFSLGGCASVSYHFKCRHQLSNQMPPPVGVIYRTLESVSRWLRSQSAVLRNGVERVFVRGGPFPQVRQGDRAHEASTGPADRAALSPRLARRRADTHSSPLLPHRWKLPAGAGGVKVDRPEGGAPMYSWGGTLTPPAPAYNRP